MHRQLRLVQAWLVGLALGLAGLLTAPSFAQNTGLKGHVPRSQPPARAAAEMTHSTRVMDQYSITLEAPNYAFQFEDYRLTARVTDPQGRPVDGVPVVFSVESGWQSDTSVYPRRVITENGVAQTYFQSNMPGKVHVIAHAGGASDRHDITVTGTGSTVYHDEYRQGR